MLQVFCVTIENVEGIPFPMFRRDYILVQDFCTGIFLFYLAVVFLKNEFFGVFIVLEGILPYYICTALF